MRKSPTHLTIEEALVRNKQNVSRFWTNSSVVKKLREEAINLTLALTREIRREMEQERNPTYASESRKFQKFVVRLKANKIKRKLSTRTLQP